jgi:hypothetical protein
MIPADIPHAPHELAARTVNDVRSCEEWLSRAALGDPREACAAFIGLLDDLEDAPPAPEACLAILEHLRHRLAGALEEQTLRFGARPLPLAHSEDAAFTQVTDLWLALLRAWQRLHAARGLAAERALIALRATQGAAGLVSAQFAARREVEPAHWRWLHQCYAHAERHHLAEAEIPGEPTCTAVYAATMLLALAHPYGLGQRELTWTRRWAERWAPKVELWRSAENGGGLAVNLEGACGPTWTPAGVPGALRFMDCSEVGRSIRRRRRRLAEGADPADLGLGRDCQRPAVDDLLASLARCWSDAPQVRQFPRRAQASRAEVALGLPAIYHAISGAPLASPGEAWGYSRLEADQLHVFQRALGHESPHRTAPVVEAWQTVDESANGFQVTRAGPGSRIAHCQLVALRPAGGSKFILCEVRWLKRHADGSLAAGVKALPGIAQPCAVRSTRAADGVPWSPGFLLPVAEGVAPTLVIGSELCGARELELRLEGQRLKIALGALRHRAFDFDWVEFSVLSA